MPETKLTYDELARRLDACPKRGTRWRHYKTKGTYTVVGSAIAEAEQSPLVLYETTAPGYPLTFARPLSEWREEVEHEGLLVLRFEELHAIPGG